MVNLDEWEVIPHNSSDLNTTNSSPPLLDLTTNESNPDEFLECAETESKNNCSSQVEVEQEKGCWNENEEKKMRKWSLNGIGAVCSIGVAAATVCIIIFGSGQSRKPTHHKLQIQIYADTKNNNKRIKQVVEQQGNRLNQAISALTGVGVPFTRAQITFGGHYDALQISN